MALPRIHGNEPVSHGAAQRIHGSPANSRQSAGKSWGGSMNSWLVREFMAGPNEFRAIGQ
ncbi:hypothetical protein [Sporosarcina sp. FSL K6-1508]|uniref:hypothetical protein n=1 Tax=Sporosarcina sp. FSL K6-1508 TaxID=2921553 RepID=UPI0030F628CE